MHEAENEIRLDLAGDAVLPGLESGSSTSHEDYKSNSRKAGNGSIMAYIQKKSDVAGASVVIH